MFGFVLQSSFGKNLLIEVEDEGPKDYHDTGTKHTHPPVWFNGMTNPPMQDYHENGIPHTHGPDSLFNHLENSSLTVKRLVTMRTNDSKIISQEDRKKAVQAKAEAGQDYHDTDYDHTHGPDNDQMLTDILDKIGKLQKKKIKESGNDYHETGYPHTHSPESEENWKNLEELLAKIPMKKKPKKADGVHSFDYHDTGFDHTHGPDSHEGNKKGRRNKHKKGRKQRRVHPTARTSTPEYSWGNAA